jgi:hypothetical protein
MPPSPAPTHPVEDSVPKVNNEVAVGADLEFQRRWWRFERTVWVVFVLIILLDLLGFFGRGYFAKSEMSTSDGTLKVQYERVERFRTPSILTVQINPSAVHDGKAQLWVSQSLVKPLGNQRIIPQPATSTVGKDGILYTFPVMKDSAMVEFALEPGSAGIYPLEMGVPGSETLRATVVVVP